MKVKTGLDRFEKHLPKALKGSSVGLLLNPSSVDCRLRHAVDIFLNSKKVKLKALFGPQHGIYGETQDNMIEWKGFRDPETGLPVYSLYGHKRKPTHEMLKDIDVLVIDLQDIGSRYYTFIWTMALCMEACMEEEKSVVVLDRPNPIGGLYIEGTMLKPEYGSFVGLHPLPARHGMTIGELALYFKDRFYPSLKLYVIRMKGWKRNMWFDNTGLPWVMPSPNMPTLDTATVYPGMCLLEATNLSEGRGTTKPFEIFGAPFIEPYELIRGLQAFRLEGVRFRPLYFQPTFQKYRGKLCGGCQIHVTERNRFKPFKTAVSIIKAVHDLYPKDFRWRKPPYEYEKRLLPIDILAGQDRLRPDIESSKDLLLMEKDWQEECLQFHRKIRKRFLLYE
ncbi:MAG: DUF1343 domain-containing protein [Nitrospirae bacterium]|nr:DUF1343 domain-containing protein [Nitrospirota bacterium]